MNRVPAIRFGGFTDPWEQRKLGEVVDVYDGVHQTPDYQDRGVMFVSVEDIETLESEKYISKKDYERDYKIRPSIGDVLMTRIGDIGTSNVVKTNNELAFYVSLALLKPRSIESYFLNSAIRSSFFQSGLQERTLVTAIPKKINKNEIGVVDILLPIDIEEQQQIGALFRSLDSLITLHQRKYDKLRAVKKSMLDKMFPKPGELFPEIRFEGFTDPWEQRKFSDLAERRGHFSYDPVLPRVEYEDIVSGQGALNKDVTKKRDERGGIVFESNDVLYGKLRPYLRNWLNPQFTGIALGDFWVLNPINVESGFLFSLIQTPAFERVANESVGTKMPRADWQNVSNMELATPLSRKEQTALSALFRNLDSLITLHQRKLELLKNVKKSLLDKMFV